MDIISEIKQAIEYTKNREFKKAEKIYKNILKDDVNNHIVLSCLGLLYLNIGVFNKSERYLEKAYALNKSLANVEGLGLVKFYLKEYNEAGKYFEKIIDKTKNYDVFDKYIDILIDAAKYSLAYKYSEQCYKLFPLKPEALSKLVYSCISVGKLKEAFSYAQKLIKAFPKFGDGWIKMGLVYEMLYRDDDMAQKCYKKALRYGDKNAGYYNLAINAEKRDDYEKSLYYIKKINNKDMDIGAVNFIKSTIYFKLKDFKKAYKYYIQKDMNSTSIEIINKLKRYWNGKKYKNETLLVYGDQGAGDCMMFSRYLPFLLKKFKKIKVIINKPILNIMQYSFRKYSNIEFSAIKNTLPRYNKSTIMSNLPYYLKMPLENIPSAEGYFEAKPEIVKLYKEKYISSDKLKVGFVWEAGGAGWRELLNRTLNVELYEPLFNIPNIECYSLQVKPTLEDYKKYDNLIDLGKTFDDFEKTAGALKNLDIVVTVDTSVAHLAGGLGVKTFMLLPYVTDWRWFDNDKKTEWYNSITIFKQKNSKSWDDVIDDIKYEIEKCIK